MQTLGLEIKFLLTCPSDATQDQVVYLIIKELEKEFLRGCNVDGCGRLHHYSLPVQQANNRQPYQGWSAVPDSTLHMEPGSQSEAAFQRLQGFQTIGIEVRSPVMAWVNVSKQTLDERLHSHPSGPLPWYHQLNLVLDRLDQSLNEYNSRIFVNKSCSVHIHVGCDDREWPAATVRNLMALTTAFEMQIDSHMDMTRIREYGERLEDHELEADGYTSIPARIGQLPLSVILTANAVRAMYGVGLDELEMLEFREKFPGYLLVTDEKMDSAVVSRDLRDWLYIISQIQDLRDVKDLFGTTKMNYFSVNYSNVMDYLYRHRNNKRTIEFKQHAGSLNYFEIMAWADFVSRLTDFADAISSDHCYDLIDCNYMNPNFSFLSLVSMISTPRNIEGVFSILWRRDYACIRCEEACDRQLDFPEGDLSDFIIAVEVERRQTRKRRNVTDRIREKIVTGSYGRCVPPQPGQTAGNPNKFSVADLEDIADKLAGMQVGGEQTGFEHSEEEITHKMAGACLDDEMVL